MGANKLLDIYPEANEALNRLKLRFAYPWKVYGKTLADAMYAKAMCSDGRGSSAEQAMKIWKIKKAAYKSQAAFSCDNDEPWYE